LLEPVARINYSSTVPYDTQKVEEEEGKGGRRRRRRRKGRRTGCLPI